MEKWAKLQEKKRKRPKYPPQEREKHGKMGEIAGKEGEAPKIPPQEREKQWKNGRIRRKRIENTQSLVEDEM